MPGAGKEDVEVLVKPNQLILIGKRKMEKEMSYGTGEGMFNISYGISEEFYNLNEVKAVIKNGVLNVVVPKVRKED